MLLSRSSSLETRCPRRWLLVVASGLLALAVVLAGVGPTVATVHADDQKRPKADPESKRKPKGIENPKARPAFPDIEDLMKRLPAGLDDRQQKQIHQRIELARRQMEQALHLAEQMRGQASLFGETARRGGTLEMRLGVRLATPAQTLVEQLDLPKDQGLVIEAVLADSAAAKAGLKVNDILLELGGKAVSNRPESLVRQIAAIGGQKAVEMVVLRKSKKEMIKGLKLPAAGATGRRGQASTSTLTLQRTGDTFNVFSREGLKIIQLRGKLSDGKVQSVSVQVIDGRQSNSYDSVEKMPAEARELVNALLAM